MLIIAESGGSKTDWRFIYADGKIKQQKTPGLNPTYSTNSELSDLLKDGLKDISLEHIEAIHFYGAGCQGSAAKEKIEEVLSDHFNTDGKIYVHHDLLAAARATSLKQPGIVCILGTGSHACLFNGEDIEKEMVNLGFILGDEGSGAYFGKCLVKDYFENKMDKKVKAAFEKGFPSLERDSLIKAIYQEAKPNKYLASFFPFIMENLHLPYCQRMLIDGLSVFIMRVKEAFPESHDLAWHFIGGVAFHANPYIRKILQKEQLKEGIFMESPIAGLTLYHKPN